MALDKILTANISPIMDAALTDRAARDDVKRSAVVRAAIKAYLTQPNENPMGPGSTAGEIADAVADRLGMGTCPPGWAMCGVTGDELVKLRWAWKVVRAFEAADGHRHVVEQDAAERAAEAAGKRAPRGKRWERPTDADIERLTTGDVERILAAHAALMQPAPAPSRPRRTVQYRG